MKGPTVVVRPFVAGKDALSNVIPDDVKIAIADVIMAFSEMENAAETVIWDLCGVSDDDGKLLTQMDSKDKLELSKKFTERYGILIHQDRDKATDIWTVIRQNIEARNKIAHGIWYMLTQGSEVVPIAVSYRIKSELGHVVGEQFPLDRLQRIADNCKKTTELFRIVLRRIQALPSRPIPQPQPQTATPHERPLPIDE